MRYDRETKKYSFPGLSKTSFEEEVGIEGAIEQRLSIEVKSGKIEMDEPGQLSSSFAAPPDGQCRIIKSGSEF